MEQTGICDFLFTLLIGLIVILFIVRFAMRLAALKKELRVINLEISRSRGAERKVWQKEKHRLWLSLLPFYRGY